MAGLFACGTALLTLTIIGLLFQSEDHLDRFLVTAGLQSVIYAVAVWLAWKGGLKRGAAAAILALAIVLRVPVIMSPPYLSADVYRYVWDGRVEAAGFNPYRHAPADAELAGLRDQELYPQIGSPYAPTIYPPLAEAVFYLISQVSGTVTAMKVVMAIFDLIAAILFARLLALEELPVSRALIYAWHPLPLWEFAGSGHIDAIFIACMLAALIAERRLRPGLAGLFLAGATLTKFYPVILAPALYRRWDWKMPAAFIAAIVIGYLPFLFGFLPGYAGQEGFDASGAGFYLLALLHHLPGLGGLGARSYEVGALTVLGAASWAFLFRRDLDRRPYVMAATAATLFMVFVSPHYPWYFSWLIVFVGFARSFALLWLTNACLLLYLVTGYVFLPSSQRLGIESMIYGPFAILALVDLWNDRRPVVMRS
jgi:alpha-1,6-mannosyltransferase